jgi:hypothetical protein
LILANFYCIETLMVLKILWVATWVKYYIEQGILTWSGNRWQYQHSTINRVSAQQ